MCWACYFVHSRYSLIIAMSYIGLGVHYLQSTIIRYITILLMQQCQEAVIIFIFSREEKQVYRKKENCSGPLSQHGGYPSVCKWPALPVCLNEWMLLNVSCGFVLFSSLESLDHVLRILCILKESMVITAGSQYVFVEDIINSFLLLPPTPKR